jgi:hypothetical protein
MHIFDSRNIISIIFVLGCSIVLLVTLGTFGIGGASKTSLESKLQKLESQKIKWLKIKPNTYSYTIRAGCMYRVESSAKVNSGIPTYDNNEDKLSIDYLFIIAKRALEKSDRVDIKYHPKFGIPNSIDVDWRLDTIDDECVYSLVRFNVP